jgi:hypothetical protein
MKALRSILFLLLISLPAAQLKAINSEHVKAGVGAAFCVGGGLAAMHFFGKAVKARSEKERDWYRFLGYCSVAGSIAGGVYCVHKLWNLSKGEKPGGGDDDDDSVREEVKKFKEKMIKKYADKSNEKLLDLMRDDSYDTGRSQKAFNYDLEASKEAADLKLSTEEKIYIRQSLLDIWSKRGPDGTRAGNGWKFKGDKVVKDQTLGDMVQWMTKDIANEKKILKFEKLKREEERLLREEAAKKAIAEEKKKIEEEKDIEENEEFDKKLVEFLRSENGTHFEECDWKVLGKVKRVKCLFDEFKVKKEKSQVVVEKISDALNCTEKRAEKILNGALET